MCSCDDVQIELKTGEQYRGTLADAEDDWNCQLRDITATAKDGQLSKLESAFVRGSQIRQAETVCGFPSTHLCLVLACRYMLLMRLVLIATAHAAGCVYRRYLIIPDMLKNAPMFKRLEGATSKGKQAVKPQQQHKRKRQQRQ